MSNKIVVYATNDNGSGFVQEIGRYDSVEEISIFPGHFAKDIEITFGVILEPEQNCAINV